MNDKEALKEVIEFVKTQIGYPWWLKHELNGNTRLYEDLKLDGDDAYEFFIAFQEKYAVNMEHFMLNEYFNNEGFDPIGISKLFNKKTIISSKRLNKSIKLNDLRNSIINGKWTIE